MTVYIIDKFIPHITDLLTYKMLHDRNKRFSFNVSFPKVMFTLITVEMVPIVIGERVRNHKCLWLIAE